MHRFVLWTLFFVAGPICAQTIWTGPYFTFEKENNADWNLEENQDHITDNVWITRRNNGGVFNILNESFYLSFQSPTGTEWAFGTTSEIAILEFDDWRSAVNSNPPEMVDQPMVLHLIEDDIYVDIIFLSWQSNSGGGFKYKRRSPNPMNADEYTKTANVLVFPNPTIDEIQLSENLGILNYAIYNIQGECVQMGDWNTASPLNVGRLGTGLYAIKTDAGVFRFSKEG